MRYNKKCKIYLRDSLAAMAISIIVSGLLELPHLPTAVGMARNDSRNGIKNAGLKPLKTCRPESRKPWSVFDISGKEKEIAGLQKQSASPDLWQDRANAQSVMRRLADTNRTVQRWRGLEKRLADIAELAELSAADDSLSAEIEKEINALTAELTELEFRLAFRGEYDARNAILAIHAGAGGTESQDWAEMLCGCTCAGRSAPHHRDMDTSPGTAGIRASSLLSTANTLAAISSRARRPPASQALTLRFRPRAARRSRWWRFYRSRGDVDIEARRHKV
jgi:hypothetical protein